ncbi:50S ribosomal protein L24 [Methanobrevibacter sp. DSM 116169]|uniref:50S ribosomal protein L24 n=1 Tax=Methanobrevibacter sp. DSM 116169 TaxID=3242727 RepID=UPI0038FC56F4
MSIQPRKQRKARYDAPLHKRQNYMSSNLSKELREQVGVRSLPIKVGDKVKVLRGDFKQQEGKVISITHRNYKVTVDGVVLNKPDGNAVYVPLDPSNLMIIDADLDDDRRIKNIEGAN